MFWGLNDLVFLKGLAYIIGAPQIIDHLFIQQTFIEHFLSIAVIVLGAGTTKGNGIEHSSLEGESVNHSVVSNSLGPQGLQHGRSPCPSPTPRIQTFSHTS